MYDELPDESPDNKVVRRKFRVSVYVPKIHRYASEHNLAEFERKVFYCDSLDFRENGVAMYIRNENPKIPCGRDSYLDSNILVGFATGQVVVEQNQFDD